MQCYSHLTEWQDLEKAVMVNISDSTNSKPKLDKIWEDQVPPCRVSSAHILKDCILLQEHYLPHILRAKLKLACSGMDDSNFTDFLNKALNETEKKELLESRYCTELALYSIITGDLDRAKYYNDISLQLFLQV